MNTIKFLYRTKILLPIIALLFALLFLSSIVKGLEATLYDNVAKPYLSKVAGNAPHDVLVTLIALSFIAIASIVLRKKLNGYLLLSLSLITLLITSFHVYLRVFTNTWVFTGFKLYDKLKYLDIPVILLFIYCVAAISVYLLKNTQARNLEKKSVENSGKILFPIITNDEPITGTDEHADELSYNGYASTLAASINNNRFDTAFAIGINGPWGTGKTSFINLIICDINKKDTIHIEVSPWNSNTPKDLIKDFFDTMQEALAEHHQSIPYLLTKYSNKLVNIHENKVTSLIKKATSTVANNESINSIHKNINNTLREINKKIIITIDDLDRLDSEEIMEVLRLIRNTANFYNTFFIVAYDRTYVSKALEKHNTHNTNQFINKIFQIEVTLPFYNKDILINKLTAQLIIAFPESEKVFKEAFFGAEINTEPVLIKSWLTSLRDVTRLSNSISLNLSKLIGEANNQIISEVDVHDFTRIEILRLNYPEVYQLLYKQRELFLQRPYYNNEDQKYTLKKKENNDNNEYLLSEHLEDNLEILAIEKHSVSKIIELIAAIFSDSNRIERTKQSIVYPSKFNLYFSYALLHNNLSEISFIRARSSSQDIFNNHIDKWIESGLTDELSERFEYITAFDNPGDYKKVTTAIFYFASRKPKKSFFNKYGDEMIGFNPEKTIYLINIYETHSSNMDEEKNIPLERHEFIEFVRELFINASSPFIFESSIIKKISKEYQHTFTLSPEEINNIATNYLQKYCNQSDARFKTAQTLFLNCATYKDGKYERPSSHAKSIYLFFAVERALDDFIHSILYRWSTDGDKFLIGPYAKDYYGNYETLVNVIKKSTFANWNYLPEFIRFYEVFKKNQYTPVEFDFKDIPIQRVSYDTSNS
ncbi:KAP family P-loop NTPase fold protein [Hymenobacter cavernae]|uniref:KAP NTPase domain-containing protein n=1 Tax=Hymenobacter cavernae TaxID=2044852 RepID=A0ABQ1UNL9_9BACT|nr:P-loop NTPase fold protein [Hymenobacter cavernae]GGF23405.1 hypothetical protein GCM10011383_38780 [Hymenobacter cavernae]